MYRITSVSSVRKRDGVYLRCECTAIENAEKETGLTYGVPRGGWGVVRKNSETRLAYESWFPLSNNSNETTYPTFKEAIAEARKKLRAVWDEKAERDSIEAEISAYDKALQLVSEDLAD